MRGYSSMKGSDRLFYVIDGMPMNNTYTGMSETGALNNAADFGNWAGDVNPEDVESVTGLKRASATALYGSREANGAILITTKRGKRTPDIVETYNGSFMGSNVLRLQQLQPRFEGWGYDDDGGYFGDRASAENGLWGRMLDGRDHMWCEAADAISFSFERLAQDENSESIKLVIIGHRYTGRGEDCQDLNDFIDDE